MQINVIDNIWIDSLGFGLTATDPTAFSCTRLIGNVSDDTGPQAYAFDNAIGGPTNMTVEGAVPNQNVGEVLEIGTVINAPCEGDR
jgi:hypothetical protein